MGLNESGSGNREDVDYKDLNTNTASIKHLHCTGLVMVMSPWVRAPAVTGQIRVQCLASDSVCKPLVSTDQFDQRALAPKR